MLSSIIYTWKITRRTRWKIKKFARLFLILLGDIKILIIDEDLAL
jgi:hypothetical protein